MASAKPNPQRLVLVCRRRLDATVPEYIARVRGLVTAAELTGGKLGAWASAFFALAWNTDGISGALEIAAALRGDGAAWSCGLAVGPVELVDGDAHALILGSALAFAEALASAAKPGEAWAHANVLALPGAKIKAGAIATMSWGAREMQAAPLDLDVKLALASIRPPPAEPAIRYRSPSTFDAEEVDPEALAARLAQLSRDALLDGDAQSLERWSDGLKATGEKDALAERMRAMARLARGRVGDALRALRDARKWAEEDGTPEARCQASLALGVGLAFAGRVDDALLEGMDALARAREAGDAQAEQACLAFLQRLFSGRRPSVFPPMAPPLKSV